MTISGEVAQEAVKYAVLEPQNAEAIRNGWVLDCCGVGGFNELRRKTPSQFIFWTAYRLRQSPMCMVITTNRMEEQIAILQEQGWHTHGEDWHNTNSGNSCQMWMISEETFREKWSLPETWKSRSLYE